MATKSEIQALITALQDGGLNTAAEVRSALSSLMNQFFPSHTQELSGNSGNIILSPTSSNLSSYNLFFSKFGNIVFVKGYITIGSSSVSVNTTILSITNNLYYSKINSETQLLAYDTSNNIVHGIQVDSSTNTIKTVNAMSANRSYNIQGFYIVND